MSFFSWVTRSRVGMAAADWGLVIPIMTAVPPPPILWVGGACNEFTNKVFMGFGVQNAYSSSGNDFCVFISPGIVFKSVSKPVHCGLESGRLDS